MVDEPAAPVTAPVTPAPAAAPAPVSTAPAPVVAAEPASAPAVPVEGAPPAESGGQIIEKVVSVEKTPETKLPGDEPTLLETVGRENDKKDEKAPEIGDKPPEKVDLAPKIEFQPYVPPEGVKLDDKRINDLNEALIKDVPPQERRDTLLGMHVEEMKRYDAMLRQSQQDAFRDTRADWRKKLMADSELGGSGFETTKLTGAEMRDLFASRHKPGSEQYMREMTEFNDMLRYTGVGDHPAFWRLLNNVGRRFKEPAAPQHDFRPPPDLGTRPGNKGRRGVLYDHATSGQNRTR